MEYLPCSEIIGFLDDYLSGEQTAAVRAEFEKHLAVCPPCVDYLKSYQQTVSLARDTAQSPDARQAVPAELVQAILAARRAAGHPQA